MSTTSKFVSEQGYSLIIDHLYLTSADNITDEKLSEYNIKYIVNATTSVPLNKSCVSLRVNVIIVFIKIQFLYFLFHLGD